MATAKTSLVVQCCGETSVWWLRPLLSTIGVPANGAGTNCIHVEPGELHALRKARRFDAPQHMLEARIHGIATDSLQRSLLYMRATAASCRAVAERSVHESAWAHPWLPRDAAGGLQPADIAFWHECDLATTRWRCTCSRAATGPTSVRAATCSQRELYVAASTRNHT